MKQVPPSIAPWPIAQIACPLRAGTCADAVRELAGLLPSSPGVLDLDALIQAVESREAQARTYLGGGVAMPHARTSAVDRLVVAVGVSRAGLDWGSSREYARLVFLVGVPRDQDSGYMAMVRRITQTVRQLDWVERAVTCPDAAALSQLLGGSIAR